MSNLTPAQIIETLTQISRDIDDATDSISELDEQAVRARQTYKVSYARAFLSCDGSMDIRRYTAELECADAWLDSELADQKHRASVSAIRSLRDRLEVGRSLGPLVRLEWGQS